MGHYVFIILTMNLSKIHLPAGKAGNKKGGFTLLEMVIVTAIIMVITALVLASYPSLGSRFSLARLAREIALSIRQAQVYGLAVREFPLRQEIYPPYGIYIRPRANAENAFIIFGDYCNPSNCDSPEQYYGSGDGFYNVTVGDCGSDTTECLERLLIKKEAFIEDVCVSASGQESCWKDGSLEELHVVFNRPDPEAIIRKVPNDGLTYNSARIIIGSVRAPDRKKTIRVWVTGQISVQDYEE